MGRSTSERTYYLKFCISCFRAELLSSFSAASLCLDCC